MTDATQSAESPAASSFSAHVQAFYQSLPAEERALLKQIWSLARSASREGGDVQGFGVTVTKQTDPASASLLRASLSQGTAQTSPINLPSLIPIPLFIPTENLLK